MPERLGYRGVCTLLGLIAGWVPMLFHGPIPQKFDVLYIEGAVTVWGFYLARLLIGFFVGNTSWPAPWYVRGPLCRLPGDAALRDHPARRPRLPGHVHLLQPAERDDHRLLVAAGAWLLTGRNHA